MEGAGEGDPLKGTGGPLWAGPRPWEWSCPRDGEKVGEPLLAGGAGLPIFCISGGLQGAATVQDWVWSPSQSWPWGGWDFWLSPHPTPHRGRRSSGKTQEPGEWSLALWAHLRTLLAPAFPGLSFPIVKQRRRPACCPLGSEWVSCCSHASGHLGSQPGRASSARPGPHPSSFSKWPLYWR